MNKLNTDIDIKIAGDKPSEDIKKRNEKKEETAEPKKADSQNARKLGRIIAEKFIKDAEDTEVTDDSADFEMIIQRRLLLSFTATVGFEQYCSDDALCGIAQKSFIDTLKKHSAELYKSSSDTGAFSFYYLRHIKFYVLLYCKQGLKPNALYIQRLHLLFESSSKYICNVSIVGKPLYIYVIRHIII